MISRTGASKDVLTSMSQRYARFMSAFNYAVTEQKEKQPRRSDKNKQAESKGLTRVLGPASRHDSRNKYGQIPTVFAQSMSPKPGLADRMRGDACRFPKTPCCPFVAACAEKSKPV